MRTRWPLLWVPVVWALLIALSALVLTKAGGYGIVLFAFLPSVMGALVGWCLPSRSAGDAMAHGAATAAVGCAFFLVVGIEGLICIAMSLPLAVPLGMFGSWLAFRSLLKNG